ncbi:NfeD family protein [Planctomyces sp. SH-PL14]|uniref:NfeD family protein n=1 Tax=Planctomyces sp. SH-PL14 TaxID=1632864 RepID=UPI00078DC6B7|nr:NfeD family protein [Planctomyces sp. SH-PL14]AMV22298.1 hypothetical protein VT03_30625 [Planctomyces sp. SH-PL14]
MTDRRLRALALLLLGFLLRAAWPEGTLAAAPAKKAVADAAGDRVGQFLTVDAPLTDDIVLNIRRTIDSLKTQAVQGKKAYLVLEIRKASSPFHHAYALADLISSNATVGVTVVGWVPEKLTGIHAFLALACHEVVMDPEAILGDLGNGQPLSHDERLIVRSIAERRRNRKISPEIVDALLDPQVSLVQLSIETKPGETEKRITTSDGAKRLRETGAIIRDSSVVKEEGEPAVFTGEQARALDIIAVQTARDRGEIATLYDLPLEALREKKIDAGPVQAAVIEVRDSLDAVNAAFIKRQIDRARSGNVQAIVFLLDGPGGYNYECLDLAQTLASLEGQNVRTVAFIPKQATAGEAIIALGCDEIYLAPAATIGEIGLAIERLPFRDRENARRILEQSLESLAEAKNRPTGLLDAMLDPDKEVFEVTHAQKGTRSFMTEDEIARAGGDWVKGALVPESKRGSLLKVDGIRATELRIAQGTVSDLDELRNQLGIAPDAVLRPMKKTWVDSLVFLLNRRDVTVLLFFMMILAWYFEAVTGTGAFAILSFLCMALFFWSRVLGGTADMLELVLFVAGAGFLLLEIFVIPGFGVFGVSGILLMLAAVIMASQTFVGSVDPERDIIAAAKTLTSLGGAVTAVIVAGVILSRFLPRIPVLSDIILAPPNVEALSEGPRLRPDVLDEAAVLIGKTGKAVTMLRPAGKAEVDGRLLEVVSEGGFIAEGAPIEIIHASKQRVVVRAATLA